MGLPAREGLRAALQVLAEALTLDKRGQYRERLLQKHGEVIAQQTQQHQQEHLLLMNLVGKYGGADRAGVVEAARPTSAAR